MADFEISTSLAAVTRRSFLSGTILASSVYLFQSCAQVTAVVDTSLLVADPTYALWQGWRKAHRLTQSLCHQQQRLETRLIEMVGRRPVEYRDRSAIAEAEAASDASCPRAFQTRWNAADAKIGYSGAKAAEESAAEHEQRLLETLWATPAQSLAEVAGKLDALLREGEWCEACPEFPWPQIRVALTDLIRIARLERSFPAESSRATDVR
jgi:hypothetical protein